MSHQLEVVLGLDLFSIMQKKPLSVPAAIKLIWSEFQEWKAAFHIQI